MAVQPHQRKVLQALRVKQARQVKQAMSVQQAAPAKQAFHQAPAVVNPAPAGTARHTLQAVRLACPTKVGAYPPITVFGLTHQGLANHIAAPQQGPLYDV